MGGKWELTTLGNVTLADIYGYQENVDIASLMHIAWGPDYLGTKYDRRNWAWINLRKTKDNDRKLDRDETGKNWDPSNWSWGNGSIPIWQRWMRNMPDQATKKMKIDGKNPGSHLYDGAIPKFDRALRWGRGARQDPMINYAMISRKGVWDDTYYNMEAPYVCNYCGQCSDHSFRENRVSEANALTDYNGVWIGVEEVMNSTGYGTDEWVNHDNTTLGWSPTWDRKFQPDNWVSGSRELLINSPSPQGTKYDRRNWAWINLRKTKDNDRKLDRDETGKNWDPSNWSWGNGSSPIWQRWMRNMPDQATKKMKIDGKNTRIYQNYAMISRKGVWDDTYYNMEAPYVCNYCGIEVVALPSPSLLYFLTSSFPNSRQVHSGCGTRQVVEGEGVVAEDNAELRGAINMTLGVDIDTPRFNNTNWVNNQLELVI
eukprot:sb/3464936/